LSYGDSNEEDDPPEEGDDRPSAGCFNFAILMASHSLCFGLAYSLGRSAEVNIRGGLGEPSILVKYSIVVAIAGFAWIFVSWTKSEENRRENDEDG
jgi:hypothetical protein